ncbi:MAG: HAD hydrolase-like protein [Anaerolineae bacterium]|nr:HAD hydrolase-like protein [Anaerolineae bacterium]
MPYIATSLRAVDLAGLDWLEVIDPAVCLGRVRHALFDFDGTISVIRRGWETIMIPMMVEMICEGHPEAITPELEAEVVDYVDRSTGILTIKQMEWLEEAVRRYGIATAPASARAYKRIYNERLLGPVRERLRTLEGTPAAGHQEAARQEAEGRASLMIAGAREFLHGLRDAGATLYLASGTDHEYVVEEATALGVAPLFGPHIYGARDVADTEEQATYTKARVIQDILETYHLQGEELLVVGDGPVEIRHARARGAVALGVAADEDRRQGLNPRKRRRLLDAGASLIVTDFLHYDALLGYLLPE